jgi:ABC-type transport system involved in cytochrome bd biosynthesis fused ATPase/permease subunit
MLGLWSRNTGRRRETREWALISEYGLGEWRAQIAVVRQESFIFDDTLEWNVTIGN